MKLVRKIALFLIVIGLVLSVSALALGATPNATLISASTESFTKEYSDVTSLDFKITAGVVNIINGDTFRITANNFPTNSIISRLESDSQTGKNRWVIEETEGFHLQIGLHLQDDNQSLTVEIPKNFSAEDFNLELGAGVLTAETIAAKKSNISIGAGTFKVNNFISNSNNINCGAGEIEIDGTLMGENSVKCGMGDVNLNLIGNPDDYSYSVKVGMGEILINGEKYAGIANNVNKGTLTASNSFNLECGMGNVNLQIDPERGA